MLCEALWLKRIMNDLNFKACIQIASESKESQQIKHIDVKYHFIRNVIQSKIISLKYFETREQLADVMTKGIPSPQFKILRNSLGIFD